MHQINIQKWKQLAIKHVKGEQKTPNNVKTGFSKVQIMKAKFNLNNLYCIFHSSNVETQMPPNLFYSLSSTTSPSACAKMFSVKCSRGFCTDSCASVFKNDSSGLRTLAGCAWRAVSERSRHTTLLQPAGELSAVPYGVREKLTLRWGKRRDSGEPKL